LAWCRGAAGRHVAGRRRIAAQHDIAAQRCLTVRAGRLLGPAAPAAAGAHARVPCQRFRRAPLIGGGA